MRQKLDHVADNNTKGYKACRNAIQDQMDLLRQVKFETTSLKTMMVDKKAIADTLPHAELKDYVPFNSDEALTTVLSDTKLTNALYAKVKRPLEEYVVHE